MGELTEHDRALLQFEETHEHEGATKDAQIRDTFGLSAPRYYSKLLRLVQTEAALAEFPLLVHRVEKRVGERVKRRRARLIGRSD